MERRPLRVLVVDDNESVRSKHLPDTSFPN
jgi:hypothetical protein